MKSLNCQNVILTNISKHKRRIVTHKKMKWGILKFSSSNGCPYQKMVLRISLVRLCLFCRDKLFGIFNSTIGPTMALVTNNVGSTSLDAGQGYHWYHIREKGVRNRDAVHWALNSKKSYYEDKEATYKISLGDDLVDFINKIKSIDIQSGRIDHLKKRP